MRAAEFERLYDEHAQALLAFLVYRTGDRSMSEDCLAETFERVLTSRRPFDRRRGSEKTWLYTIALNLVRDHARRSAAHSRALERVMAGAHEPAPSDAIRAVELRDSLHRALQCLTAKEREAVALRYGGDLTCPEIAGLTQENLSTIEGRVYRALRKLRDELELADAA
jgi:RNA polymerase sigma-70 factor (ECF subfamily)